MQSTEYRVRSAEYRVRSAESSAASSAESMVESRIVSMSESSVGPTQCLRRCRRIVNRIPRPDAVSPHRFSTLYSIQSSTLHSTQPSTQSSTLASTLASMLHSTQSSTLVSTLPSTLYSVLRNLHSVIRTPRSVLFTSPKKVPHLCRFRLELHCILDLGGRYVATARTRPVGSHLPYIMFVGKGGCRGCRTLQGMVNLAPLPRKSKSPGKSG